MLYSDDDVHLLDWEQSCWDKEAVISSDRVLDHILDMGVRSTWTGCSLNQTPNHTPGAAATAAAAAAGGRSSSMAVVDQAAGDSDALMASVGNGVNLTCRGERRYDAPRKVAVV